MRILWPLINAVQMAFACLWTAGCITAALIATALRGRPDPGLAMARRLWAPGILRLAGAQLLVEGQEWIDPARAYFFAANHQSWIDIPALFAALPLPVLFLAKRELARVPFLGRYVERMGMVFVDRAARRQAAHAVDLTVMRLREGRSMLSFPEGTRTRDGHVQRFKAPTFAAAVDASAPVVPIAIEAAFDVLPRGGFRVRPGVIRVRIGAPIPTAGLTRDDRGELAGRVQSEVERLLEDMRSTSARSTR